MALEEILKSLDANISKLVAATETLTALRTEAIETVKSAAAPAPKAAAKETKAAAPVETKAADPAPTAAEASSGVYEELAAAIGAYVAGTTREDERAARKDKIKKLLQHDAIKKPGTPADVFDAKNIKDDAIQVFKDNLAALVAKGDLLTAPAASSNLLD